MLNKLKTFPHDFLIFFRLIDEQGCASLTNIALMVVLYKLVMVQTTSITDIGALFIGLSGYNLKKYINMAQGIQSVADKITKSSEL